jgi:predicted DCC family thiol-disulfide oxidoreductase YuxK
MTATRPRPALIYDGDCGFCRRWIARWSRSTGDQVRYLPYQRRGILWRYRLPRRAARRAVQLVEPDGRRYAGAAAVFRVLLRSRSPWVRLAARAGLIRGVRRMAEVVYRYVAAHRAAFSRAGRVAGRVLGPAVPRHRLWVLLSRPGLALRGLGIVYVVAFTSLKKQVLGLYGARGIVPIQSHLQDIDRALSVGRDGRRLDQRRLWWRRFQLVPSLLWLDASDAGLKRLCTIGQIAGAALALGIGGRMGRRLAATTAWAAYLSFVSGGRDFLRFQWDVLLLEAGLQAVLGRPRRLLTRMLAFRLQFESGLAKLASGDTTWRNLSACGYHQETQPLPTPIGWYVHHLPRPLQKAATASTLLVECVVPFLAFGPRRLRQPAFAILTGFQGLIALTGNYAFFNWLTAVLNLGLVELPAAENRARGEHHLRDSIGAIAEAVAAAPIAMLGVADLSSRLRPEGRQWEWLQHLAEAAAPFHVVSSYGLFSAMTTSRPEIVIEGSDEGSDDGGDWREYGFRYKPGDVLRAPRWVAPHQPRLDWQMWFAALGYPPGWFARLIVRLLEGSPEVLALLERNPFPTRPPRFVRALLYDYKMTDLGTHRKAGSWWVRTKVGVYFPSCTLRSGPRPPAEGAPRMRSALP